MEKYFFQVEGEWIEQTLLTVERQMVVEVILNIITANGFSSSIMIIGCKFISGQWWSWVHLTH